LFNVGKGEEESTTKVLAIAVK